MNLNLSYIIASVLYYMKKLNIDDLNKICTKLIDKGYLIDNSYDMICYVVDEWKDFFMFEDNTLTLKTNTNLISTIFINVLDDNTRNDIFNAMLYRNNKQR